MNCPNCNVPNPDDARFCAACGQATSMTEPSLSGMKAVPDLLGKEIAGRYRVVAKLGEGGMGAVYQAEQISLKRQCAIKLLRSEVAGAEIMLRRFNAEAEAVAKLSHPNTVNIYDFGQDTDGTLFIAMEFVEGTSLRATIQKEAPFPIRRALHIASQVAASLTDAHSHDIVHRDLKPDNVMLQTRGRERDIVRVLDFGIAKLRDEGRATQQAMTQAGDMLGTPQYMAPEQIRGEQIDGRTDIYALGCMIYEMVTARMPFEGPTIMALLSKHLTETAQPPSQRRPELGIPPAIDQLVMTAISKDRNARPPTMETFGEQIAVLLAQMPPETGHGSAITGVPVGAMVPTGGLGVPATAQGAPPGPPPGYATPNPQGYVTPGMMQPGTAPPGPPPGGMPGQPPPSTGPAAYGTPPPPGTPYPYARQGGQPVASGNGRKALLVGLGALVIIGGGIGIWAATRGGGSDAPADGALQASVEDGGVEQLDPADADTPRVEVDDHGGDDDVGDDDTGDTGDTNDTNDTGDGDPWEDDSSSSNASSGGSNLKHMLAKLEGLKNKVCKCSTLACMQSLQSETIEVVTELSNVASQFALAGPAVQRKYALIQQQITVCTQRIATQAAVGARNAAYELQAEALSRQACACRNVACARTVKNAIVTFANNNPAPKGVDENRLKRAVIRAVTCMRRAGLTPAEIRAALEAAGS